MKVVSLGTLEKVPVNMPGAEKAFKQLPIGSADGAPTFSMRVFTVQPGGHTPFHTHEAEHVNYMIEGEGELVSETDAKPIRGGDFALVLPGEKHQYRNTSSDRDLVLICAVPKAFE